MSGASHILEWGGGGGEDANIDTGPSFVRLWYM